MLLNVIFGSLALLSVALALWQWAAGRRFPLHQRRALPASSDPAVTLLKPLKGRDAFTEDCLRSWFAQEYAGPVQLLFGVASAEDPVCEIVRELMRAFPARDAQLVVCGPPRGANLKVSKLAELERLARHDVLLVSDADVRVPPDLLANIVGPLQEPGVGLVNCFYRLANPSTPAMEWEAVAINADFWSQVLQSRGLKPMDFALGAVMITRRRQLEEIGGFAALADCLADDYQLGNRIARRGYRIGLSPVVVECWSGPMDWRAVWKHQLRWARTIRVCQPGPYFSSILSNGTLWPLLWLMVNHSRAGLALGIGCGVARVLTAFSLQRRLAAGPERGHMCSLPPESEVAVVRPHSASNEGVAGRARGGRAPELRLRDMAWLVPLKDLLQTALWFSAFLGNGIEWRGERMRLRRDGTLERE